jgi:hypothetical protein
MSLTNDQNNTFDSSTTKKKIMFAVFIMINLMIQLARHVETHSAELVYKNIPQLIKKYLCTSCLKPLTIDLTRRRNGNNQENTNKIKDYKRSSILSKINLVKFQTNMEIDSLRDYIKLML